MGKHNYAGLLPYKMKPLRRLFKQLHRSRAFHRQLNAATGDVKWRIHLTDDDKLACKEAGGLLHIDDVLPYFRSYLYHRAKKRESMWKRHVKSVKQFKEKIRKRKASSVAYPPERPVHVGVGRRLLRAWIAARSDRCVLGLLLLRWARV